MKHRNSHLLVGYWSRARRGRDVPDQADIDPRAIKRMLANIFILEAQSAAFPVYRLAGTALCDRFGQELRGTGFLLPWEARAHETVALLLGQSLAARLPLCLSSVGETARSTMIEIETIVAPMRFGPGAPHRFVGITQFLGDMYQLGGSPITSQRLMGSKLVREEPFHSELDPPESPPHEDSRRSRRAPHLRLVISRERPTLHRDLDERMFALLRSFPFSGAARLTR